MMMMSATENQMIVLATNHQMLVTSNRELTISEMGDILLYNYDD